MSQIPKDSKKSLKKKLVKKTNKKNNNKKKNTKKVNEITSKETKTDVCPFPEPSTVCDDEYLNEICGVNKYREVRNRLCKYAEEVRTIQNNIQVIFDRIDSVTQEIEARKIEREKKLKEFQSKISRAKRSSSGEKKTKIKSQSRQIPVSKTKKLASSKSVTNRK